MPVCREQEELLPKLRLDPVLSQRHADLVEERLAEQRQIFAEIADGNGTFRMADLKYRLRSLNNFALWQDKHICRNCHIVYTK